jgi:hypothetical protein
MARLDRDGTPGNHSTAASISAWSIADTGFIGVRPNVLDPPIDDGEKLT